MNPYEFCLDTNKHVGWREVGEIFESPLHVTSKSRVAVLIDTMETQRGVEGEEVLTCSKVKAVQSTVEHSMQSRGADSHQG